MKKIVIIISIVVLAAGGYFVYSLLGPREQLDPFTIVPDDAVAIIETSEIDQSWNSFKSKGIWENLKALPSVAEITNKLSVLDSILSPEGKKAFFDGKKVVASFHIHQKKDFDFIFYIPLNTSKDDNFLEATLDKITKQRKLRIEERIFKGHTIYSINPNGSTTVFSYILYKNLFIGCFSPVLLEDLIVSIDSKRELFFWKREDNKPQKVIEGKTNLYVRYEKLPLLISLFSQSNLPKSISSFAEESVLEISINEKDLLLNGFTYASTNKLSFVESFKNQKPQRFYLKNYIPNNTSALYYYGFDKAQLLRKSFETYWTKEDPKYMSKVNEVNKKYKIDIGSIYEDIGNEIGLCHLDADSVSNKLAFIHSQKPDRLFLQLSSIVTIASSINPEQRMDNEVWEGVDIRQMNIKEFPSILLGPFFDGFDDCYYAKIDNYVVLSNNKQNLKNLIKDISEENVWGKTLSINSSLSETIQEFNVGFFVNTPKVLDPVLNASTPELKEGLLKNKNLLEGFDFLALQFSRIDDAILTHMVLSHDLTEVMVESENKDSVGQQLKLGSILNNMRLVDSRNSDKDVLIQDSLKILNLISSDLKIRWKYDLKEAVVGDVFTVDIGKDRKWEYVFATAHEIYAMDSKGNVVTQFPFILEEPIQIKNISVIDYSDTKSYRILVSDKNGDVYMYDLDGKRLQGWDPMELNGEIYDKVRHFRVGSKDLIIGFQKNGIVNVMNRKAEMNRGFPLNLNEDIRSYTIRKGSNFEKTKVLVQNQNGEIVTFNLNGEILTRYNPDALLCPDPKNYSYIIAKQQRNGMSIISGDEEKLFDVPYNIKDVSIKYYDFSSKGQLLLIKNNSGSIEIFNNKGKQVVNPVKSDFNSDIFYNERKKVFKIYSMRGGNMEVIEF